MDVSPRTESAARTLLDEGISWLEASQFDKATSAFAEAASIASQEGNALLEARAYANIGTACAGRYDHHAAVDMYKKALKLFQASGDSGREVRTLHNIATAYLALREFEAAEDAMAQYRMRVKNPDDLRSATIAYESAKAAAQSPGASFAGIIAGAGPVSLSSMNASPQGSKRTLGGSQRNARRNKVWRGPDGVVPAPLMLEFGFENLRWSDVAARVNQGIANIDAIAGYVKTRSSAEEKFGKALRDVVDSASAGGSVFGQIIGMRASVDSECNTLFSALDASKVAAAKEATRRLQFATFLENLCSQLASMKAGHSSEHKRLLSRGKDVINIVRSSAKKLAKATARLEKARMEEADSRRRLDAVSVPTVTPPPSDAEIKRRTKSLQSASQEVSLAEAALQEAAAELIANRKQRDVELRNACRTLQHLEEERLSFLVHVLRIVSDADENVIACNGSDHAISAEAVDSADPHSDLRLFIHNKTVDGMLRQLAIAQRLTREKTKAKDVVVEAAASSPERASPSVVSMFMSGLQSFGSEEAEDEGEDVVPVPVPATSRAQYSMDNLKKTEGINPMVDAWVDALFAGTGVEIYAETSATPVVDPAATPVTDLPPEGTFVIDGETVLEVTPQVDGGEANVKAYVDVLFRHSTGRAAFIRSLNRQRGVQQDISVSFDRMCTILMHFLDACEADGDVACTKMAMIMSETFYKVVEPPADVKRSDSVSSTAEETIASPMRKSDCHEFVQKHITGHPIWQEQQFWEEAFYRSVREEVAKLCMDPTGASGDFNPNSSVQPGSVEWTYTYKQMVFGQLGSYTLNMRSFGLPPEKVNRIVTHLAVGNGLPSDMLQTMLITSLTAK